MEEFANTMAVRTGGYEGVEKLIDSKSLGTVELSTGVQIMGTFTNVIRDERGEVAYLQTTGPTALANRDKELIKHGTFYHTEGFGSPVGNLKGINLPIENMSPRDLDAYGIYEGKIVSLEFESGVKVEGKIITGTRDIRGKILLITFDECTVTYQDQILFRPEWGVYDMAIGKEVVSAFAGPADVNSFENVGKVSETKTHKIIYSESEKVLFEYYNRVRVLRESETVTSENLKEIFEKVKAGFSNDWLLPLELYELASRYELDIQDSLLEYLEGLKQSDSIKKLIDNGLDIIRNTELESA